MSFERLIWRSATRSGLRLLWTVAGVALASACSALLARSNWPWLRWWALLPALLSVSLSLRQSLGERTASDAVLVGLGFSREQLVTLLVMEGMLFGGLGALLGVLLCLAPSALGMSPQWNAAQLSRSFVDTLLTALLGSGWPARALWRSRLADDRGVASGHSQ
ncbi:MAG: hypothetical protein QM756_40120 [Polyangiaceae bacterium]